MINYKLQSVLIKLILSLSFASCKSSTSIVDNVQSWLSKDLKTNLHSYNRSFFNHWTDPDKDCQDTRNEILIKRTMVPVSFKSSRKCVVRTGKWKDFYFNEIHTDASKLDIDHVVPLKNAWESGANNWKQDIRTKFANDPENLVITNRKYNRQKGAQSPLSWHPQNRNYACLYLNKWVRVKIKYNLRIIEKIYENINQFRCK